MVSNDQPLPAALVAVQRRFERWRSTHRPPSPILPALWRAAVRSAGKYGTYVTARALRLDYSALKRRVEASLGASAAHQRHAAFVEIGGPTGNRPATCSVEVERPGGAKLRVELRGSAIPDIADLARRFASEEP